MAFESIRGLCESPIELILLNEFIKRWDCADDGGGYLISPQVKPVNNIELIAVHVQYKYLNLCGLNYRPDFCIAHWNNKSFKGVNLLVDVDGHEFHEKTKEQAKKDKKRDRRLQKAGFNILHFTGSEVYNNSTAVVKEIEDFIYG